MAISALGWIALGAVAWIGVAAVVAVLVGRTIRARDLQRPHDADAAPDGPDAVPRPRDALHDLAVDDPRDGAEDGRADGEAREGAHRGRRRR